MPRAEALLKQRLPRVPVSTELAFSETLVAQLDYEPLRPVLRLLARAAADVAALGARDPAGPVPMLVFRVSTSFHSLSMNDCNARFTSHAFGRRVALANLLNSLSSSTWISVVNVLVIGMSSPAVPRCTYFAPLTATR